MNKKFRILIAGAALIAAAPAAYAQDTFGFDGLRPLGGPYLGVEAGGAMLSLSGTVTKVGGAETKPSKSFTTIPVGGFAGFGHYIDDFFVGGEIRGAYNVRAPDETFTVGSHEFRIKNTARGSFSLLSGFGVGSSLLYARAGGTFSNIKVEARDTGSTGSWDSVSSFIGGTVGIGFAQAITEIIDVRVEYSYAFPLSGHKSTGTVATGSQKFDLFLHDNRVLVGVAVSF